MSANEFTRLAGLRLGYKKDLKKLEYRAENHIMSINNNMDPLIDWEDIKISHVEQSVISLKVILNQAKELREKISKIDDKIGPDYE